MTIAVQILCAVALLSSALTLTDNLLRSTRIARTIRRRRA